MIPGSFDGAAASSSGTLIGNGVRSAGLFGGSTAKEDGTAAAFSTSSGTTKDKLFVSSSSRARGGRSEFTFILLFYNRTLELFLSRCFELAKDTTQKSLYFCVITVLFIFRRAL